MSAIMASRIEMLVEELATPVAEQFGLFIYDVEFKKEGSDYMLRVFIDRDEGGVNIEDCENVHRPLQDILEEKDVDYSYLEVSSPGIERQLKRQRDFDRYRGQKVLASFYKAVEGSKKLEGILVERNEEFLVIDAGEEIKIENENVASVRLVAEF